MADAVQELPRGPVALGKSGKVDYPDGYIKRMLEWREAARAEAMAARRACPEWPNVDRYIKYILGDHWEKPRPRYRSKFVDNRIGQIRKEILALLTDVKPTIDVYSTIRDDQMEKQAEIIKQIILYEWTHQSLDMRLLEVIDIALLGGVGYWRIGAVPPGRMVVSALGMDSVMPIMPGRDLQESAGILYRAYKPLSYFTSKWPHKCDGLEREALFFSGHHDTESLRRPLHISEYVWNSYSPHVKRILGIPEQATQRPTPFQVVQLEEFYIDDPSINESPNPVIVQDPDKDLDSHNYWYEVKPGERLFPRKRVIVFAGNRIMYDGPSVYWHGLYPYVQLSFNPVPFAPGGLSLYRNLEKLQDAVNEIGAGILDTIRRALNPVRITRQGAISQAAWSRFFPDLPGAELMVNPTADVTRDIKFLDPPVLPSYVFAFLIQYLLPTIDRMSGIADVSRLAGKRQVPGGDTIEEMRQSLQTMLRLDTRYIEIFLREAGEQAVANIFQFWTVARRMRILGPDGVVLFDFDYDPGMMTPASEPKEEHWRNFAFNISQGSLHASSSERNKLLAVTLFRIGAISRAKLLEILGFTDADRIQAEIAAERMSGLAAAAVPGTRTPRMTRGQRTGSPV